MGPRAHLVLLLHAHLPFVRHPEHERFLEESWLYEAAADCYLPLAEVIQGWAADGIPARLTLSVSPTLLAMWGDPLLRDRTTRSLLRRIEFARLEIRRTHWMPQVNRLARFYLERFERLQAAWLGTGCDLAGFLKRMQDLGLIELITTAATHPVLPLLEHDAVSLTTQVELGCRTHEAAFGQRPAGFWLPECAWAPCVEPVLARTGIRWSVLDTHGLVHATPRPQAGSYAPVQTAGGLILFGRDHASARQVWSREGGYPGDPRYRDFYRDAGWDLDLTYVEPYLPAPTVRGFTGLKYHRVGRAGGDHELYEPQEANRAVSQHADHFVDGLVARAAEISTELRSHATFVAPYDAELFGHWWFEGPLFLDAVVRRVAMQPGPLQLATGSDVLHASEAPDVVEPPTCSWGEGGYLASWLAQTNRWILPGLHDAAAALRQWIRSRPPSTPQAERAAAQAARELLLAQASDWPFMIHNRSSPHYAEARVRDHLAMVHRLAETAGRGESLEPLLSPLERRHNLFPEIDWRWWSEGSCGPHNV